MKKILSLVIICAMALGMLSMVSFADETSGTFEGTEVTWSLVGGVMTIDGTGAMPDYRDVETTRPWVGVIDTITKVIVKGGVTHVGSSAFTQAAALAEVVLEEGVSTVGQDAFSYNDAIVTVTLPASLTQLGQGVFYSCDGIKTVKYADSLANFKANVTRGNYNDDYLFVADWGAQPGITWPGTITLAPKFGGAENWRGATWLLLGPTADNEDFKTVIGPKIKDGTYDVKYVITDETTGDKYIIEDYFFDHDDKATWADPNGVSVWNWTEVDIANTLLRLCASDYGIPVVVGHTYTVTGEVTEAGELKYNITSATGAFVPADGKFPATAGPAEGFVPPHSYTTEDVIPDPTPDPTPDTPVVPETVTLNVAPIFDVIENWSGKTYLIWQLPDADAAVKDELHAKLKDGTYKMKYVITDTTAEKTYIIEEYFFDVGGEFGDWSGWYRIATGHYGITLEKDHAYTLEFSVTEGENELYNGKSEAGAFVSNQAGFIENGAITPDEVPHSYTEPTTPPVTPDPPATGDNAVYAIVFAVVAILGMAVVVTKKVRA